MTEAFANAWMAAAKVDCCDNERRVGQNCELHELLVRGRVSVTDAGANCDTCANYWSGDSCAVRPPLAVTATPVPTTGGRLRYVRPTVHRRERRLPYSLRARGCMCELFR